MLRGLAAAVLAMLVLVPNASAATTPTAPVYDAKGHLIQTPFTQPPEKRHLNAAAATAILLANDKVADWLTRYPKKGRSTAASYKDGVWTVDVWWGAAGEIAKGKVDDKTGAVTEAFTGPQVAWGMARGGPGAFGGKKINSLPIWLAFCIAFLIGLADFRRPLSLRNLDLLVLLSFSVSLWRFNRGDVFGAMLLAYPPLAYLLVRAAWIGIRGRATPTRVMWPAWILIGATVFLAGFRIGLNLQSSNVIDVGYSGVIGADRIVRDNVSPYGHMPVEDPQKPCGPADQNGEIRDRIQTNGRCESANPLGDTYGPVSYEAYIPADLITPWSGKWDRLPVAHNTAIAFDLLCMVGLLLLGLRFGGWQTGAMLAFAWAAYPFTQYVSMSNTNDSIQPAFMIWGLWLASSPAARGVGSALASWVKFGPLLTVPLWLTYPEWSWSWRRAKLFFLAAFAITTLAAFSIEFLEPNLWHALKVFYVRTFKIQFDRHSPFSLWDWGQYHAKGLPDLHVVQRVLQVLVALGALAVAFVPRRKSLLQLAALTGAILIGFELVLTHWFYLYLPWFFPFVALALVGPLPGHRENVAAG